MKAFCLLLCVLLILTGCEEIGTYEFCGTDTKSAACGPYDLDKGKFVGEMKPAPIGKLKGAMCITKKEFLTKLKPRLKELGRIKKDSKKKKLILDGYLDIRDTYNLR